MDEKALSSTISSFAAKFCNKLKKNESFVSSPLSAEFVLALLALGAKDSARTELLAALGFADDDSIRSSFASLSSKVKSIKGVTLDVANKVYIKEGPYELNAQLKEDAIKTFDAGFEKVNFADSGAAAHLINSWVESKTNNRIKDLLTPDSFNDDTRLVLVNALYFKGSWKMKFNPIHTTDQPFHIDSKTTVNVPMMYKEDNYKFGVSEELQSMLIELPYEGNEASMVIVLPNEIEGLNGVMEKLAGGHDLIATLDSMFSTKVQVTIPKFKIETEINLTELLPKLGISAIFDRTNSDLDNLLTNKEPLFVSKAVQKAFIEVNEEGAEAAAATGACARRRRAAPTTFVVDRPSLACVVAQRAVVLVARYQPPASAQPRDEL